MKTATSTTRRKPTRNRPRLGRGQRRAVRRLPVLILADLTATLPRIRAHSNGERRYECLRNVPARIDLATMRRRRRTVKSAIVASLRSSSNRPRRNCSKTLRPATRNNSPPGTAARRPGRNNMRGRSLSSTRKVRLVFSLPGTGARPRIQRRSRWIDPCLSSCSCRLEIRSPLVPVVVLFCCYSYAPSLPQASLLRSVCRGTCQFEVSSLSGSDLVEPVGFASSGFPNSSRARATR